MTMEYTAPVVKEVVDEEFALGDIFFQFDVIMALSYFPQKTSIVSMANAQVPKFIGDWSLTKKEKTDVRLAKKINKRGLKIE